MTKLLLDEAPLMVLPSLVSAVGLHEAIVLQQLHYLLEAKFGKFINGKRFIYKTYDQWRADYFSFWHVDTVRKTFRSLEQAGYVESIQEKSYYRQKLYTINYEKVNAMRTNSTHPSGQNARLEADKTPSSIQREDYTKTTGDADAPQAPESSTSTSTFYEAKESDNTTSTSTLDPVLHAMEFKLKTKTPAHIIGAWRAGEHLKDLCVLFAEVTNAEVVKHDSGKWIGGAKRLYELHPTREELVRARDYATKNEYPMTHPGAAVETIKAIRQMNPQKPAALNHPQPVVYEVLENNYDD